MILKAEGIVLRASDYGESNKIITLYTKEYGKIGLMARGAKKPKNPLASVTHVLFYGLCLFKKGRGLGMLYQAETLHALTAIQSDIEKMGYSALIVELADRLLPEGQRSEAVYQLLQNCLLYMEKGVDAAVLAAIFAMKMMVFAGIEPQLKHCVSCGRQTQLSAFSVSSGGVLCSSCAFRDPHAVSITPTVARLLLLFKQIPLERIGKVDLKAGTMHDIQQIIDMCYEQNAGIKLRARRFLDQMHRFQNPQKRTF